MPLKMSSNSKGTWITWEAEDESLTATFRVKPEMSDQEILATLMKATAFIAKQMGIPQDGPASPPGATVGAASTPTAPPNAPRVAMMPPASLSDLPAGGAPADTFGWSSLPTMSVPENLSGDWEMIPPGEA